MGGFGARNFGCWYAAGSLAASVAVFELWSGALGFAIAAIVLIQGVSIFFVDHFWKSFEGFVAGLDWAAGRSSHAREERKRAAGVRQAGAGGE